MSHSVALPPSAKPDLFGHPRALAFLFTTEMWERFSYYGMRSLLVLYMVNYLFAPERFDTVIGLAALKRMHEALSGPLDVQPFSSLVYGDYTMLVYLTPIFGGLLADRLLGHRHTVVIGASLMAIGHFMMAFEPLFLLALVVLILGNGAFKPNMSAQVGDLYAAGASRHLPPDRIESRVDGPPLTRDEIRTLVALAVLFVPTMLFWATYEQQGNTIALWADTHTDRTIALFGLSAEIPTTSFQAFNPF